MKKLYRKLLTMLGVDGARRRYLMNIYQGETRVGDGVDRPKSRHFALVVFAMFSLIGSIGAGKKCANCYHGFPCKVSCSKRAR